MEMKGAGLNPGNQKPCKRNLGIKPALDEYLQEGYQEIRRYPSNE